MTRTTKTITALILLALLASTALAQPGRMGLAGRGFGGMGFDADPDFRLERLTAVLDLTEDQIAAIDVIHTEARADRIELDTQIARLQNEFQGEMLQDNPSETKLLNLVEDIGAVRTTLRVRGVKTCFAVRAQLTDEQRTRFPLMGGYGPGYRYSGRGDRGFGFNSWGEPGRGRDFGPRQDGPRRGRRR